MSKYWQYVIKDVKVCGGVKEFSINDVQFSFQEIITWTKKIRKGRQEWDKAYKNAFICPWKLKIVMKIEFAYKAIFFKETLG